MTQIDRTQRHFLLQGAWFTVGTVAFFVVLAIDQMATGRVSYLSKLAPVAILLPPVGLLITVGALKCETFLKRSFRRIRYTCPNCSFQGLPHFRCPGCGDIVEDLEPTVFGVWRARCECGHPLPTSDLAGRLTLTKVCPNPNCQSDLRHDDLGRRSEYRIAIVGATSSGKTNLMVTSVWQLEKQFAPHNQLEVSLGHSEDEKAYRGFVEMLESGRPMIKTASYVPSALSLSLTPVDCVSSLLYVYDAAGESFVDEQHLSEHPIDKYDGIILVVDPVAEEGVEKGPLGEVDKADIRAANPAPVEALEILGRLITVLERVMGIRPGGVFPMTLAVVVTKADVGDLDQRYGIVADSMNHAFYNMTHASDYAERRSRRVRAFLRDSGLGNLLRLVESRFGRVGYFAVSSLSPAESERSDAAVPDRGGFRPRGVVAPLIWVCYHTDALSDTDSFDRTFMNWHFYLSRCVKGREGVTAQRLAWTLLSVLAIFVVWIFMTFDLLAILVCGGLPAITLVILYICLYAVLIRQRFSD